ncbi:hypothetical protein QFC19_008039 [Naganishia cerealis]|uniref:Uncharacterized protein n=1 Tax=Naganishia cerealis TaxID=610337 RepID=A0ACC2V4Z2_9TREE|nr:hypothetical protein QFC19_008039 [Naganishia cerealis]
MPSYLNTLHQSLHQHLPALIPPPTSAHSPPWLVSLAILIPSILLLTPLVSPAPPKRTKVVKPTAERVLIIGASSGCGEDLAKRYASMGASICIVARSKSNLEQVAAKCRTLLPNAADSSNKVLLYAGDICNPDDMIAVRELIVKEWQGLDTLHIISGLSSTQTLLEVSSVSQTPINPASSTSGQTIHAKRHHQFEALASASEKTGGNSEAEFNLPGKEGLHALVEETRRLADVNMTGVAVSVATFAGGLACFRSAAVENGGGRSGVRFLATCPGTIDNDFRRKSSSSARGIAPAEGFDRALLSVDDGPLLQASAE